MSVVLNIELGFNDRRVKFKLHRKDAQVDRDIVWSLEHFGCCEPEVTNLMLRAVRPGDTVVDGGANVGFFTLLLVKWVGENGKVFAFEPSFENGTRLTENALLNGGFSNVLVDTRPLWSRKEKIRFNLDVDGGRNSIGEVENLATSEEMETTTLDDIAVTPRLIKLDIEGAEEYALRGAMRHLHNQACPYIIAELHIAALEKLASSQDSLRRFMHDRGYTTFLLHKDGSYPSQLTLETEIQPLYFNCNILFSTPEAVAEIFPTTISA